MVQKIGKYFFGVIVFTHMVLAEEPQLTMTVNSLQGAPQHELIAGKRAILEVTVSGDEQSSAPIVVEGLDVFESSQQGSQSLQMSSINGKTTYTRRQQFIVVPSKVGMLSVGPAYVEYQGKRIYAPAVSIPVVESASIQDTDHSEEKLTMIFDKERYVVGERIRLTIRLEYAAVLYSLFLEPLQLKDFHAIEVAQPKQGTFIKNGSEHGYMEWQYELQAKKPGAYVLPSARATYQIAKNRSSHGGLIQHFFGPTLETETIESSSPTLTIEPIEHVDQTIPVGIYRHFTMKANTRDTSVGEPVTISLSVEGDGALHFLPLSLQGMDDSVNAYESRKEVQDNKGVLKRVVEYIVQPKHAGQLLIPEQLFTAYNPQEKKLYTLKAPSLTILVNEFVSQQPDVKKTVTHQFSRPRSLSHFRFLVVISILQFLAILLFYRQVVVSFIRYVSTRIGLIWWRFNARRRFLNAYKKNDVARMRLILEEGVYHYRLQSRYQTMHERFYHVLTAQGLSADHAYEVIRLMDQLQYAPSVIDKTQGINDLFYSWRLFLIAVIVGTEINAYAGDTLVGVVKWAMQASSLQEVDYIFGAYTGSLGVDELFALMREQSIGRLWLALISVAPIFYWQLCVYVLVCLIMWCAYMRRKRWFWFLQITVLAVLLIFVRVEYLKFFEYGIVPSRTAFYNGPDSAYGEQFTTQITHMARIKRYDQEWSLVECAAGTGWVPTNSYWLMHVE